MLVDLKILVMIEKLVKGEKFVKGEMLVKEENLKFGGLSWPGEPPIISQEALLDQRDPKLNLQFELANRILVPYCVITSLYVTSCYYNYFFNVGINKY